MEDLKVVLQACVDLMKFEFTIWGFTLSFWQILIWSLVAVVILYLVVEVLR